ncbi:MAG: hypothetical protein ACI4EQ_05840 [Lachnospiraceae bacterium]
MKRKVLVTMLCLAISVSAIACGTENTTEQLEATATEQTMETQELETQETETQETADNVVEIENYENYDNYEELVSVPVDGRDGSQESPYQVGDKIYLPKILVAHESGEDIYSSITISIEEVTSEYVKIAFEFGTDFLSYQSFSSWYGIGDIIKAHCCNENFEIIGNTFNALNQLNDSDDMMNYDWSESEKVLYYQDYETFKGCTEDTVYIQLTYKVNPYLYEESEEALQRDYYVKVTE